MSKIFQKFSDWVGTYYGSYDGRLAKLQVSELSPGIGSDYTNLLFQFTDLERNVSYSFKYENLMYGQKVYLLDKIEFDLGPGEQPSWPYLAIHTWDTNYISGVSSWHGKSYGMSFQRADAAPTKAPGKRFERAMDFVGWYRGHYDGRNAELAIWGNTNRDGTFTLGMMFIDLDRRLRYRADLPRAAAVLHDWTLINISLYEDGGNGVLTWPELNLHTWDTAYLSGLSQWQSGLFYGMSFQRIA